MTELKTLPTRIQNKIISRKSYPNENKSICLYLISFQLWGKRTGLSICFLVDPKVRFQSQSGLMPFTINMHQGVKLSWWTTKRGGNQQKSPVSRTCFCFQPLAHQVTREDLNLVGSVSFSTHFLFGCDCVSPQSIQCPQILGLKLSFSTYSPHASPETRMLTSSTLSNLPQIPLMVLNEVNCSIRIWAAAVNLRLTVSSAHVTIPT